MYYNTLCMGLQQQIQKDIITSLKSGQSETLSTLRMLLSQIKNEEIAKQTQLSEDEIIAIIRKQVLQLKESIVLFLKGKRDDLACEYKNQITILSKYLPIELSDKELTQEIQKIIKGSNIADKNKLMGLCITNLKQKAFTERIITIYKKLTN